MKRRPMAMLFVHLLILLTNLTAQESARRHLPRYKLIDLGTFGGPQTFLFGDDRISQIKVLNNGEDVVGWSSTATPDPYPNFCWDGDCFAAHTFQWQNGVFNDLGTLPGGASSDTRWVTENGLIAGDSQNGAIDPLNLGFPQIRAVLWKHGKIIDLGTLEGGYESIAHGVNSAGQVVGLSLTTTPDPLSMLGSFYGVGYQQTRAFLWQNGTMQDLGTLGTGTNAIALLINESGQIAGDSYTSSDPSPFCFYNSSVFPLTTGAFLWEKGRMIDLGGLGGTCTLVSGLNNQGQIVGLSNIEGDKSRHPFLWDRHSHPHLKDLGTLGGNSGVAEALNEDGDAVGFSTLSGDAVTHATVWSRGRITDLGAVGSDQCSIGFSINSSRQVVGISGPDCSFAQANAFLWESDGPMIDLNDFVPPSSDLHLRAGATINDRGEIAVVAELSNGDHRAVMLIPCHDVYEQGCRAAHKSDH
jgi:probable HAF family extracellular repeat protein